MMANLNLQFDAHPCRSAYTHVTKQLGHLGLNTAILDGVRALADEAVRRGRFVANGSQHEFDTSVEEFERALHTAARGASAFNIKVIRIARRNVDVKFDLEGTLASAYGLATIVKQRAADWRNQMRMLAAQAAETHVLWEQTAADRAGVSSQRVTHDVAKGAP